MDKIPISVLVTTKNEEKNIERCLIALTDFAEIIVVDSNSTDRTQEIARQLGARVENFTWNGTYPKKRQWTLENISLSYDWVFWVDADEEATSALCEELRSKFLNNVQEAGLFVRGRYIWRWRELRRGMMNNKIALMDRRKMEFPVVGDLSIAGMGEMEGHYQPVLKSGFGGEKIGQVAAPLLHYAYDDEAAWTRRHERYAHWEAEMTRRKGWPKDPVRWREAAKRLIRTSPLRPFVMFFYSYVWKLGVLDGCAGFEFALSRKKYCDMILKALSSSPRPPKP